MPTAHELALLQAARGAGITKGRLGWPYQPSSRKIVLAALGW